METQSAIDAAIAQAQANAGAIATANDTQVSTVASATNLTVDDMLSGSMVVDHWLKVNEYGLFIGSDRTPFTSIPVTLNMDEVQYCWSVKWGQNPVKYGKTYDKVTDVTGKPWTQVLQNAQSQDAKAYEYRSADVPFTLVEDLKDGNGEILASAGQVLGASIATTGWKIFAKFLQTMQRAGADIHSGTIKMDLGFEPQNRSGSQWGLLTYNNPEEITG